MLLPLLAGCGGGATAAQGDELKGTITVSGAWALYPMMVRWGEEFTKLHPAGAVRHLGGRRGQGDGRCPGRRSGHRHGLARHRGRGGGQGRVLGRGDQGRGVPVGERRRTPSWRICSPRGSPRRVFTKIYITGEITNWGQVVGRPEITDPIHVYTRSDAAGAPDTWAKYLGKKQENLLGIGVYGDPGIAEAVVKDPLGIGYNNLNYAFDPNTGKAGGRCGRAADRRQRRWRGGRRRAAARPRPRRLRPWSPGKYPSPPARMLNLVTKGKPTGLARDFLLWIVGDGQKFLDEAGYVPLTPEQVAAAQAEAEVRRVDADDTRTPC